MRPLLDEEMSSMRRPLLMLIVGLAMLAVGIVLSVTNQIGDAGHGAEDHNVDLTIGSRVAVCDSYRDIVSCTLANGNVVSCARKAGELCPE